MNNNLRKPFDILKHNSEKEGKISQFNYTNNEDDENIDIYMSESSDNMSENSNSDSNKNGFNLYDLNDLEFDIQSQYGTKEYKTYNYKEVEVKIDKYYFEKRV